MDGDGNRWVASPFANAIYVVDPDTGDRKTLFSPTPEASTWIVSEIYRRLSEGEPVLKLLAPEMWGPMPGLLTERILTADGNIYVSALGDASVLLDQSTPR